MYIELSRSFLENRREAGREQAEDPPHLGLRSCRTSFDAFAAGDQPLCEFVELIALIGRRSQAT